MSDRLVELRAALAEVRRRWTRREVAGAWTLGAAAATALLLTGLVAVTLVARAGLPLVLTTGLVTLLAVAALVRALWPLRRRPTDLQFAHYIEERAGGLDDVLVTAVASADRQAVQGPMLDLLAADALRALRNVDVELVVPSTAVRSALLKAAVATAALAVTVALFAPALGRSTSVAAAYLFPARITFEITPGTAKVRAGEPVTIAARVLGVDGGLVPSLVVGAGDEEPVAREMARTDEPGRFTVTLDGLERSIAYRVAAGGAASAEYLLTVIRPPRVERIDLHFEYPDGLGLQARDEDDSGDIYAPAGTRVRVTVTADKPISEGRLVLDDGTEVALDGGDLVLGGALRVDEDGSYRVALADTDGLENPGDTEYFIRTLLDRPPDVRVLRPGGDREVSPLEEVVVEARADDDFGIRALELVFQAPGGEERIVPLSGASTALSASGSRTIYLEDLGVEPGDFVTYYARATDIGRGRRSAESRSDIFFLEVKPFEEEFVSAQSQAGLSSAGGGTGLEDLAEAQKAIIVATWNLDARARKAGAKGSEADIRAVGKAQSELQAKVEQASGRLERSMGRRSIRPGGGLEPRGDDPLGQAAVAMGKAVGELGGLATSGALPHEREALNQIFRAMAEVRRRQIARQQGGGGGGNNSGPDLSTLFDQELRKRQETNYETPNSSETREEQQAQADPLERIRELARRQEALNRQQRELGRDRETLDEEELRRRLERLTRDQTALREQAEALARQIEQQRGQQQGRQSQQGQQARGQGQQAQGGSGSDSERMRQVSEAMREAATGLRRQETDEAQASADSALERLRQLERQMQAARPDERQRALGDLQLESRQLADAQRRIGQEAARTTPDAAGDDARRRLAGEQERLAERTDRLEEAVRRLSAASENLGSGEAGERRALADAARELERQELGDRMREAAEDLREASQPAAAAEPRPGQVARREGGDDAELARALDRVAERLGAASGRQSAEAGQLSEQLSRTAELREQLGDLQRMIDELQRQARSGEGQGEQQAAGQDGQGQAPAGGGQQAGQGQPSATGQQGQQGEAGQPGGGNGGGRGGLERMQREVGSRMREAERLAGEIRRDNPGMGSTPEGWWPSVSAPGTEAFKQDFARWESLKKNLLVALEDVESELSDKLRARENQDRLNAGRHEAVPESYRELVEEYYRSLARPRKPQR
ncbi:MAG: hypothetical protein AB7O67_01835 [Vicinamibacterales bacterium]